MEDVLKLAETLANMPTLAIGFTKRLLNQSYKKNKSLFNQN